MDGWTVKRPVAVSRKSPQEEWQCICLVIAGYLDDELHSISHKELATIDPAHSSDPSKTVGRSFSISSERPFIG